MEKVQPDLSRDAAGTSRGPDSIDRTDSIHEIVVNVQTGTNARRS
jgi:hypothetical protein